MLKFAATPIVRKGKVVKTFVEKKDVYERYLRPSNLANSGLRRYATETSTLGVLYPAHSSQCVVSIYLDVGYLELLILRQGNARARRRDERGVEHPRLSV